MTRLESLQARVARWFVRSCQLSVACLVAWLVLLLLDIVWPGVIDFVMDHEHAWAQIVSWLVILLAVGLPIAVPMVAMTFLVLSMMVGREPSRHELRWSWLAWLMCAGALLALLLHDHCASPQKDLPACQRQAVLFVLDQFNHGSFGDIFDVFDISFSSLEFGQLGAWAKFNALAFRMLCAVSVLSLLMLWLAAPLERLAQTKPVLTAHHWARRAFFWACYASLASLLLWSLLLLLDAYVWPELVTHLSQASSAHMIAVQALLMVTLAAIPALVPLVSLAHLSLSLLVGHELRGREFAWSTFLMILCSISLVYFVDAAACHDVPKEQASACGDQVFGFVADQFYKGGFADVFDVYELKLGEVESDKLSLTDKLMILNFRFLCAVYVVGVLVALRRWWTSRRERTANRGKPVDAKPKAAVREPTPIPSEWPKTVFADTLPMPR